MAQIKGLSAQDLPPGPIRDCYNKYSAIDKVDNDLGVIDLQQLDPDQLPRGVIIAQHLSSQELRLAFDDFIQGCHALAEEDAPMTENIPVYSHNSISGLLMIPALFPTTVQAELLSRMFHRDLSSPEYQTNIHLHYDVTYPEDEETHAPKSFFGDDSTRIFESKDPQLHEPLDVQSFLEKRLRWIALGIQHEGTANMVSGEIPSIPGDIAKLMSAIFPDRSAHAAIVDIHSTRDTQPIHLHRDVGKDSDTGLMSVSFGCDGLFLVSHDDGNGCEVLRLRSGDTVYMNGVSRFAWHGVPKILPSSCPAWLANWPSLGENFPGMPPGPYQMWEGWMSSKRITLNVQQRPTSHIPKDSAKNV